MAVLDMRAENATGRSDCTFRTQLDPNRARPKNMANTANTVNMANNPLKLIIGSL